MSPKVDLIVIGNSGAGKTSLISRYFRPEDLDIDNYKPTLGVNVEWKMTTIN